MRTPPHSKPSSWIEALSSASERYLTADIHGARSALLDAEALLRTAGSQIPQSGFALATTLAKRSEIEACLGASETASSLLDEALRLFQSEPLGIRTGLTTSEAVQAFIRQQERAGVKWREHIGDTHPNA